MRRGPFSIGATLLLATGHCFADPAGDITWEAPEPCPRQSDVRKLVASWLGQNADELDLRNVRVIARVRAEPSGFSLDMTLESPDGSDREQLLARRCEALAKIVALKLALAVDPLAAVTSVESQPTSAPRLASPPAPARAFGGGVRAAGAIAFGPLPGIGPAASLIGSLRWSDFRLELGVGYWFPRSVSYAELSSVGARLEMAAAQARACPTALLARIEIPLCAGVEAGVVRASGFGLPEARIAERPWVAVIVGPALVIPLWGSVYAWFEADAAFGLVRPGFRVRNLPRLYRPETGAAEAWAGLELRIH